MFILPRQRCGSRAGKIHDFVLHDGTAKVGSWERTGAGGALHFFVPFYSDLFHFCIVWTINMSTEILRKKDRKSVV